MKNAKEKNVGELAVRSSRNIKVLAVGRGKCFGGCIKGNISSLPDTKGQIGEIYATIPEKAQNDLL